MATVGLEAAARRYDRRHAELTAQPSPVTPVRRDPLTAVGVTFVAGVIVGSLIGWFGHHPAPRSRPHPAGAVKA